MPTVSQRSGPSSTRPSARRNGGDAQAVTRAALSQLADLTGRSPDTVSAIERIDDGWRVEVELVELERVPATTTIPIGLCRGLTRSGRPPTVSEAAPRRTRSSTTPSSAFRRRRTSSRRTKCSSTTTAALSAIAGCGATSATRRRRAGRDLPCATAQRLDVSDDASTWRVPRRHSRASARQRCRHRG